MRFFPPSLLFSMPALFFHSRFFYFYRMHFIFIPAFLFQSQAFVFIQFFHSSPMHLFHSAFLFQSHAFIEFQLFHFNCMHMYTICIYIIHIYICIQMLYPQYEEFDKKVSITNAQSKPMYIYSQIIVFLYCIALY